MLASSPLCRPPHLQQPARAAGAEQPGLVWRHGPAHLPTGDRQVGPRLAAGCCWCSGRHGGHPRRPASQLPGSQHWQRPLRQPAPSTRADLSLRSACELPSLQPTPPHLTPPHPTPYIPTRTLALSLARRQVRPRGHHAGQGERAQAHGERDRHQLHRVHIPAAAGERWPPTAHTRACMAKPRSQPRTLQGAAARSQLRSLAFGQFGVSLMDARLHAMPPLPRLAPTACLCAAGL